MRSIALPQGYLDFSGGTSPKVVREYRKRYGRISALLDSVPELLDIAHGDFERVLSESDEGRQGKYTSENLLRALVVMFLEGVDYREAVVRIEMSEFLRNFVRLGPLPTMDYSFLCRSFGALREETWTVLNDALARHALSEKKISAERLRVDTTVYETNVHYPTDSSLLWDTYRTIARLIKRLRPVLRDRGFSHRFHTGKIKRLAHYIGRNAGSRSKRTQRRVRSSYRVLIDRVGSAIGVARHGLYVLGDCTGAAMEGLVTELRGHIPVMEKIVDQAERRVFRGEKVPNEEKILSLFEPHTELIKRGKARADIEFGHKVILGQTGEKFIVHYEAFPRQRPDQDLLDDAITAHGKLFKTVPELLAADRGFYESSQQLADLRTEIPTVAIEKLGRRNADEEAHEHMDLFKAGRRFRAGIEGSISVLKRAFRLGKCLFKGIKRYIASLGCVVFCHNLALLARL